LNKRSRGGIGIHD